MPHLLPTPDQQGIERTKALYRERLGKEISEEQAADVLGRVMRLLYLLSKTEGEEGAAAAEETGIRAAPEPRRTSADQEGQAE